MKKYKVIEIKLDPSAQMADLKAKIDATVQYNKAFFETELRQHKKTQMLVSELKKYEHTVMHGGQTHLTLFSNLGEAWLRENKNISTPLNAAETEKLIAFADSSNIMQAGFVTLIFDEIEWRPGQTCVGTYGQEKACTVYGDSEYLGNAIVLSRKNKLNKPSLFCVVSCEAELRDAPALNELINTIGTITNEEEHYAPECQQEREQWNADLEQEAKVFNMMKESVNEYRRNLLYPLPDKMVTYLEQKEMGPLSMKPIATRIMKDSTWKKNQKKSKGTKLCYEKELNNRKFVATVFSLRNGYILSASIVYRRGVYFLGRYSDIGFHYNVKSEEEVENYFKNLKYVFEIIENISKQNQVEGPFTALSTTCGN